MCYGYLTNDDSYFVTANKRYKDGSYGIDKDDKVTHKKEYPGRPSRDTIAEQVLEALKII